MTMHTLPVEVDQAVVDRFLKDLGLEPGDKVREVRVINGGIEVTQLVHTGSGYEAQCVVFGTEKLATRVTQIGVRRDSQVRVTTKSESEIGAPELAGHVLDDCLTDPVTTETCISVDVDGLAHYRCDTCGRVREEERAPRT